MSRVNIEKMMKNQGREAVFRLGDAGLEVGVEINDSNQFLWQLAPTDPRQEFAFTDFLIFRVSDVEKLLIVLRERA